MGGWEWAFFSFLVCLLSCFFIYDSMIERFCGLVYSTYDACMYAYPVITHDCIPALYMIH